MITLQKPEVLECYFDGNFSPPLAAMRLGWAAEAGRIWPLPRGVSLAGPPPGRFGVSVERRAADAYAMYLLWGDAALGGPGA